ncbi:MAG: transcription antitermination factor NusB [Clostridia bacterium]|jgi:N utilization substance protein B|nr:transcription antitermination factor NusB [Clostridia bacterium]MDD3232222.1 transcription antitermination factor NusB [Clostridia bacterium]MDD4408514.1 transcription antitermination factor NusB [Clostridia bacterium]
MRTQARITAFKVIFASLFETEQKTENIDAEILEYVNKEEKLNSKDIAFAREITDAFFLNKNEVKTLINKSITGYEIQRVYKVDLALIYLAITEYKFLKTPKPIVVNEILEIAKIYSTDKSSNFINGVLAKID